MISVEVRSSGNANVGVWARTRHVYWISVCAMLVRFCRDVSVRLPRSGVAIIIRREQ